MKMKLPVCQKCGQVYLQDEHHRSCPYCHQELLEATQRAWKKEENDLDWGLPTMIREKLPLEEYVEKLIAKTPRRREIQDVELQQFDMLTLGDRSENLYSVDVAIDFLESHIRNLYEIRSRLYSPVKLRSAKPPELSIKELQRGDIISIWEQGKRNRYFIQSLTDDIAYGLKLRADDRVDKRSLRSMYGHTHRFSQKQLRLGRIERRGVRLDEIDFEETEGR